MEGLELGEDARAGRDSVGYRAAEGPGARGVEEAEVEAGDHAREAGGGGGGTGLFVGARGGGAVLGAVEVERRARGGGGGSVRCRVGDERRLEEEDEKRVEKERGGQPLDRAAAAGRPRGRRPPHSAGNPNPSPRRRRLPRVVTGRARREHGEGGFRRGEERKREKRRAE